MDFLERLDSGIQKAERTGELDELYELLRIAQQDRKEMAYVLKSGLPVVSSEIGFSVQQKFLEISEPSASLHLFDELVEKNPCVASFVSKMGKSMTSRSDVQVLITTVALVIKLLESQIEANQMADNE